MHRPRPPGALRALTPALGAPARVAAPATTTRGPRRMRSSLSHPCLGADGLDRALSSLSAGATLDFRIA